jgi:hypothetical protein
MNKTSKKRKSEFLYQPIYNDVSEIEHLLVGGYLEPNIISFVSCLFDNYIRREDYNLFQSLSPKQLSQIFGELLSKKTYWHNYNLLISIPNCWKNNEEVCIRILKFRPEICNKFNEETIKQCIVKLDTSEILDVFSFKKISNLTQLRELCNCHPNKHIFTTIIKNICVFNIMYHTISNDEILYLLSKNGQLYSLLSKYNSRLFIETALKQNKYAFLGECQGIDDDILLTHPLFWVHMDYSSKYKTKVLMKLLFPDKFELKDGKWQLIEMPISEWPFDMKVIRYHRHYDMCGIVEQLFNISVLLYKYNKLYYYGFPPEIQHKFTKEIMDSPVLYIKELNGTVLYYTHITELITSQIIECIKHLDISMYTFDKTQKLDYTLRKYLWIFHRQQQFISQTKRFTLDEIMVIANLFEQKITKDSFSLPKMLCDICFNFK